MNRTLSRTLSPRRNAKAGVPRAGAARASRRASVSGARRIEWLIADLLMPRFIAAFVKLRSSATAANAARTVSLVVALLRAQLSAVRKATTSVIGKSIDRANPTLWSFVDGLAKLTPRAVHLISRGWIRSVAVVLSSGLAAPILTLPRRRCRCEVQQLRGSEQSSFEKELLGNSFERSIRYLYRSTL